VEVGFRKLALHQLSFSGLGAMSGGPLGGRRGGAAVASRWNPPRLSRDIGRCHRAATWFPCFEVRNEDFAGVLDTLTPRSFAYLDPPYYVQGPNLYKHSFTEVDHARLATLLRSAAFDWLLSYDDHPRVRDLYSWASIESIEMVPSIGTASASRGRKRELLIRPASPRVGEIVRL
jgi:DNA adenine methylase